MCPFRVLMAFCGAMLPPLFAFLVCLSGSYKIWVIMEFFFQDFFLEIASTFLSWLNIAFSAVYCFFFFLSLMYYWSIKNNFFLLPFFFISLKSLKVESLTSSFHHILTQVLPCNKCRYMHVGYIHGWLKQIHTYSLPCLIARLSGGSQVISLK